jgi:hypothetical protein
MKVVKLSALCTGRLYPSSRKYSCYSFLLEGHNEGRRLCQWKILQSGIKLRTFRPLAQCLTHNCSNHNNRINNNNNNNNNNKRLRNGEGICPHPLQGHGMRIYNIASLSSRPYVLDKESHPTRRNPLD